MSLTLWATISLCMLLSIDLLSFSLNRSGWRRFVSTFMLFYAQVVSSEFILGALGILTQRSVIFLNLLITAGVLWLAFRLEPELTLNRYIKSICKTVKQFWQAIHNDNLFLVLAALFLIALIWILFLGAIFPSIDVDGNSYHLTFVAYAMQNHSIADPQTSLLWLKGYPKGGELIQMWNVIVARNDTFVDLTQVPFLFLGIFSLYKISRELGFKSKEARFSALLFIFIPIVLNQLKATYVDIMLCTLFLAALAMVVSRQLSRLDLVLLGIIYSLLIAIKDSGLYFVLITLPFLLAVLYQKNGKKLRPKLKEYVKQMSLVAAPVIFGIYWYVKDYVVYGSPLYPFGLKFHGHALFPGPSFTDIQAIVASNLTFFPHGYLQRVWFVWTEQHSWYGCMYNYDSSFAGLGPIWFVVLIPAIIVAIYLAIKLKNRRFLAVLAAVTILFAVYPLNYYTRYTMFIVGLGIISLAFVLSNVNRWTANFVKILILFLVVSVLATNLTLCSYTPTNIKGQINSLRAGTNRGPAFQGSIGEAFVFLENTIKPNQTVAYDSTPYFIYPLWRTDYANKVTYIPATTNAEWLQGLKAQHVDFVFTSKGSKEFKWAQTDHNFKSVYKDSMYEIYQFS